LRIKGAKPDVLGKKWQAEVHPDAFHSHVLTLCSLENLHCLKRSLQKATFCSSTSPIKQ
jgi:hypothetical protein